MAGTTRRMSMPTRAPIENAASVHAARSIPRRSKRPEASGDDSLRNLLWLPAAKYGWKYHDSRMLSAAAATTTAAARPTSFARVQRTREGGRGRARRPASPRVVAAGNVVRSARNQTVAFDRVWRVPSPSSKTGVQLGGASPVVRSEGTGSGASPDPAPAEGGTGGDGCCCPLRAARTINAVLPPVTSTPSQ